MPVSVQRATTRPSAPPIAASSADSVRSWRTTCQRLAPIDSRTAISLARDAPRASSRLAMLAQAISSTKPVTASSRVRAGCARRRVEAALAAGAGLDGDPLGLEAGQRRRAHALLQAGLDVVDDRAVGHVDGGLGLLDRRARLQPGEDVGPVVAPVVEALPARDEALAHRERHEDLRQRGRAWCR